MHITRVTADIGTCHIAENNEKVVGTIVCERCCQIECCPLVGSHSDSATVVDASEVGGVQIGSSSGDRDVTHVYLIGTLLADSTHLERYLINPTTMAYLGSSVDLLRHTIVVERVARQI